MRGLLSTRMSYLPLRGGLSPASSICLKQDVQDSQDVQEYEVFASTCFFRSARTYMSIEKRAGHSV